MKELTQIEMARKGAKARWKGKSKEDKIAHVKMMSDKRWKKSEK